MIQACPPKMSNRTKNFCIELKYLYGLGLSSRCWSSSTAILNFFFFLTWRKRTQLFAGSASALHFAQPPRNEQQTDRQSELNMWRGRFKCVFLYAFSFAFLFKPSSIEGCGLVSLFFNVFLTSSPHVTRGEGCKRRALRQTPPPKAHRHLRGFTVVSQRLPGLVSATCGRSLRPGSPAAAENPRLTSISSMSQAEFISPRGSSVAFRCRVPDRRMIGAVCSPSPGPNTHLASRYGRRRWKKYRDFFQIPLNPRQRTLNPAPH